MDFSADTVADPVAEARLCIQVLTERGLPLEALLLAMMERYNYQLGEENMLFGFRPSRAMESRSWDSRRCLSVSTDSSCSSGRASGVSSLSRAVSSTTMSNSRAAKRMGSDDDNWSQPRTPGSAPAPGPAQRPSDSPHLPPGSPQPVPKATNLSMADGAGRSGEVLRCSYASSNPLGPYLCTFCGLASECKSDWKRHEEISHEWKHYYPCANCDRIFWSSATLNQHHRDDHGCRTCPHTNETTPLSLHVMAGQRPRRKRAWGCGFCAALMHSHERFIDHVARHYEACREGRGRSSSGGSDSSGGTGANAKAQEEWKHSNVIYALLHQRDIKQAWTELHRNSYANLSAEEQPMISWVAERTGHAQEFFGGTSRGNLQDLLEFYDPKQDDAHYLATLAHDKAFVLRRSHLGIMGAEAVPRG